MVVSFRIASNQQRLGVSLGITGIAVVVVLATYLAGGSTSGIAQLAVIPVVLAAAYFGIRVGVIAALVLGGGLALVPLDVQAGQPQSMIRWVLRIIALCMIAALVGVLRSRLTSFAQARSRFLSTVSHELRTPLTSVVGFAESLWDRRHQLGDPGAVELVG